ncbi:hypothetical protein [Sulfurimonas sp. C5]|uniref:hypothetical protein n=1 Tax=Sulfurimonas sp. C5 TaxID=3036947 RepID=UPI002457D46A|nr:hypothetical protein [Sulfurimonas sp. C5]MDH4943933.1 hypothetical protein [Sulfurimonas sp. C5]
MRKNMLLIPTFLFLTACTSPSIYFSDKSVNIITDKQLTVEINGNIRYKTILKLTNIKIGQYVYEVTKGNMLTVEELSVDTTYKFHGSISKTVGIGFSNYKYDEVFSKANMSFFELTNKDEKEKTLYLITYNRNKKNVKFIYGDNKKLFNEILEAIKNDKALLNIQDVIIKQNKQKAQDYIKTTWSEKNIILDGLIYEEGGSPLRILQH